MRVAALFALLSAPFLALAQDGPNAFKIPSGGLSAKGGAPLTLQWTPTTQGTVSLILRSGASNNLDKGTIIASSIPNSGIYTWTPSNSLTRGSDYAVEIVDDSDPTQVNYTPPFVLDTTNTVASATPTVTLGATSVPSTNTKATASTSGTSQMSGSAMSSSSASAASSMVTSGSMSTGGSPTGPTSSSGPGASFQNTATGASTASGNSGARATAAAGMLGLVALGALAL